MRSSQRLLGRGRAGCVEDGGRVQATAEGTMCTMWRPNRAVGAEARRAVTRLTLAAALVALSCAACVTLAADPLTLTVDRRFISVIETCEEVSRLLGGR